MANLQTSSGAGPARGFMVGAAGGGGFIDGSQGQLPEGHDENSDEEDSEPEAHREQEPADEDEDDGEDDVYDYEFIGVGNQALESQTEMDVGGVHNETGDECEDEEDDEQQPPFGDGADMLGGRTGSRSHPCQATAAAAMG